MAEAERAHWVGALPLMSAADRHAEILHTARTLYWFSDRWEKSPEWRTLFTYGVRSAAALGDRAAEAHQLNCLAWAHWVGAHEYARSEELARQALRWRRRPARQHSKPGHGATSTLPA